MRWHTPIFLVGFMGSGKTEVGRMLAAALGRRFVDLDATVEAARGRSIAELFASEGETAFRRYERAALTEVCAHAHDGPVVALGGGTPLYAANLLAAQAAGLVVFLRATFAGISARLRQAGVRPLWADGGEDVRALFDERQATYEQADLTVDTSGRTVADIVRECAKRCALRLGAVLVRTRAHAYPVCVGPLAQAGALARELLGADKVALVTDENVAQTPHANATRAALEAAGIEVTSIVMPAGEAHKTLAQVETIARACVGAGLDRTSALCAVGGGVVGDLAGLVAATLFRGVAYAQVPTTLLAMVDAAIGGKTAVNIAEGKNLVGAFWQPRFVLADPNCLATLPERELVAAFGEVVKYALLGDPDLFLALEENGRRLDLGELVVRCARQKARIVREDEGERGVRALLNLGHTVGHALEAASLAGLVVAPGSALASPAAGSGDAALRHGEAVALGLRAAVRVSVKLRLCDPSLDERLGRVLATVGLAAELDPWLCDPVRGYLAADKKRAGQKVHFVALREVGAPKVVGLAPEELWHILNLPEGRCYDSPGGIV